MKHARLLLFAAALIAPTIRGAHAQVPAGVSITVCALTAGGTLEEVEARYDGRDTTVVVDGQRRPFASVYPTGDVYAAPTPWYINSKPIFVQQTRYVKYGLPRILAVTDVEPYAAYGNVPVFAEAGLSDTPEVVYVPVNVGCEFQPYMREQ